MPVLSVDQILQHIPALQGKCGENFINRLMCSLSLDRINQAYDKNIHFQGSDFADNMLKELGVKYQIGNADILSELPKEQAFITVSNHPYGGLDGLILADIFGHIRADYKIIVNKILMLVKTMNNCFISVQPTMEEKKAAVKENIAGIKQVLSQLSENHPIGIFPAGAVSDYHIKGKCVRDREWQESILRLIQKAQVPIVPIRFFDFNSKFFYFLGLIDWRIRTLRLPKEVCNKEGKIQHIGIGPIISVEEQQQFNDTVLFGKYLREKVYQMPMPAHFIPREELSICG